MYLLMVEKVSKISRCGWATSLSSIVLKFNKASLPGTIVKYIEWINEIKLFENTVESCKAILIFYD